MERLLPRGLIVLATALTLLTTSPYEPSLPCDAFVRNENGCWSPTKRVEIRINGESISLTPGVTFCRGGLFNGLALAEQLDTQCMTPSR